MKRAVIAFMLLGLAAVGVSAQDEHMDDGMEHGHGESYFDSGSSEDGSDWLANGDTYEFTFTHAAGTFAYHCHPHPWMVGNITVEGDAMSEQMESGDGMEEGEHMDDEAMATGVVHEVHIVEGDVSDVSSYRFEPENLEINIGDTVRWINDGQLGHTVTSEDPAPESHESTETPGVGVLGLIAAVGAAAVAVRRK